MNKCDFCKYSSPKGKCYWTIKSVRQDFCEVAIKRGGRMTKEMVYKDEDGLKEIISVLEASGALDEHDKRVRTEVIDKCIVEINKFGGTIFTSTVCDILEMLKEQNK